MEKDKDIIQVIVDEPSSQKAESGSFMSAVKAFFSEIDNSLIIVSAAIALAVIIAAPIIGFSVPKSEGAVERSLISLKKSDKEYLKARDTKSDAENTSKELNERLSDKQKELEEFHKSQDNLDKITESNASLEEEKNKLQSEIKQKQDTLSSLEKSITSKSNKTVTWASGDYSVGKDIAAGKYMITGSGSIAIANSGKALTNKMLKADGESFTLSSGDRVHIDGSAKLTPQ